MTAHLGMQLYNPGVLSSLRINFQSNSTHLRIPSRQHIIHCRSGGGGSSFRRGPPTSQPRRQPRPQQPRRDPLAAPYEGPTDAEVWLDRIRRLPPTARSVALQQLLRIEEEGAFSGLVGGSPSAATSSTETDNDIPAFELTTTGGGRKALDERSRRQATDLMSSVTRWQRRLSWVLTHLPKPTNLAKMDPPLRIILLMGAYEILETGLAPHAVNEYVNLAKAVQHAGCGAVANGVLRTLLRCVEAGEVPKPDPPGPNASPQEVADAMAVVTSHPTWLVQRWLEQFGRRDAMLLLQHDNKRPAYSLRLMPGIDAAEIAQKLKESGDVKARPSAFLPDEFLVVESGLQVVLKEVLRRGQGQVQDEAAGLVVAVLDPQPGESVLDCCAAPGGKTLFSAARMQRQGRLVALDSSVARLKAISATATSQGIIVGEGNGASSFLTCVGQDARQYCVNSAAAGELFDRVLVDAPCSGTGVLAKRADLRWRRKIDDLQGLCVLQLEILEAAAHAVKSGGLLVYSTCSLEPEENEGIVKQFLDETEIGREYALEPVTAGSNTSVPAECLNKEGMLQMLPQVHGTDGAFAARLRRR